MASKQNSGYGVVRQLTAAQQAKLCTTVCDFLFGGGQKMEVNDLTPDMSAFLYTYAVCKGLEAHMEGPKDNPVMIVSRLPNFKPSVTRHYKLSEESLQAFRAFDAEVYSHLQRYISRAVEDPRSERRYLSGLIGVPLGSKMIPPQPYNVSRKMRREKESLPIYAFKQELLNALEQHKVIIVSGETGSGKSTQVPQYILEDAANRRRPCRIIVTQPRRMAATTLAERVASERGEECGSTSGFHIRFQRNTCETTNLIFTTSGFLLSATLSSPEKLFRGATHIIIDEVHERDMDTDFMLIPFKKMINTENTKLILMSATMNTKKLSSYFNDCPIYDVPGRMYEVQIYYLEDILEQTDYKTKIMQAYLRTIDCWPKDDDDDMSAGPEMWLELEQQEYFDQVLTGVHNGKSRNDSDIYFEKLKKIFEVDKIPIDTRHQSNGMTAAIVACKLGCPDYLAYVLRRKPDLTITDNAGKTAEMYVKERKYRACENLLNEHKKPKAKKEFEGPPELKLRLLLQAYRREFDSENEIDHDLIFCLIEYILSRSRWGSIMVFLPGYSDIQRQRNLLKKNLPANSYKILILHSQMSAKDQKSAAEPLGVRKIILSTNIGQTSITIPDLMFVIDSGKSKQQTYNPETNSSNLVTALISKADANQRSGRSGRTQEGCCFRVYAKGTYDQLSEYCEPEIRRSPLTQICLLSKTLAKDVPIDKYLALSLDPPPTECVQQAVNLLKTIEAIGTDETISNLGKYLIKLPLDVHLGKCLLYAAFLGCLDPMLDIVSIVSSRDPFQIPGDRNIQESVHRTHKSFGEKFYSDLIGYASMLQQYSAATRGSGGVRTFCEKNYLSPEALDSADSCRRQISRVMNDMFKYNVSPNCNKNDLNMVRAAIAAGFYPNIVAIDKPTSTLRSTDDQPINTQRNSCLNPPNGRRGATFYQDVPYEFIIYVKKTERDHTAMINQNTAVSPLTVALMCGCDVRLESGGDRMIRPAPMAAAPTSPPMLFEGDNINDSSSSAGARMHCAPFIKFDNWLHLGLGESAMRSVPMLRQTLKNDFGLFLERGVLDHSQALFPSVLKKLLAVERNRQVDEFNA